MRKKVLWPAGILLAGVLLFSALFFLYDGLQALGDRKRERLPQHVADAVVTPGPEIREMEDGFSSVLFEGDYDFDAFLAQGGARSDRAVLSFLLKNLIADAAGLRFAGAVFGCSTISVPSPDGGYLFGRNFDWKKCDGLVVSSHPASGYKSISTVNLDFIRRVGSAAVALIPDRVLASVALYAPLDGMNEKGLCVAVNMIEDSETVEQNTEKPDLTTTTAIRLLLDKAADVDEAVNLLKSYDFHASFGYMVHFALADARGNNAVVEYVHNKMNVLQSSILTNFYLTEGDKKGIGSAQSHTRYEILERLRSQKKHMDSDDVRDALSRVSKRNFTTLLSTEWSVVFDQKKLTARYYHRENYDHSFSFTVR